MRSDNFFKPILLGIVLAAVLMPAPAKAQWTVFDPANYSIQVKKQIEELNRWLQTTAIWRSAFRIRLPGARRSSRSLRRS